MSIFPNPANQKLNITFSKISFGVLKVLLCDLHGREVAELFNGDGGIGMQRLDLQLPVMVKGTYLVRIYCGDERLDKKNYVY